jgi:hypothetical protein
MTPADLMAEAFRLSHLIDAGIQALREQSQALAESERVYRRGKSAAWARSAGQEMLAREREAWVDSETADLRYERDLAEGMRQAALEAVRARRTQVSALQSAMAATREEAAFARTGVDA